jgi:hypothetical protein
MLLGMADLAAELLRLAGRAFGFLEHFHLLCSVSGATKEALAVGSGNGLKGDLGGQE